MLFRNLILFRLPADWSMSVLDLEEALAQRPLRPCGTFEMQTRGWVACGDTQRLVYAQGGNYLVTLGVDQKLLPASVIAQETRGRSAELAVSQGHPVGRRQMRELRARVTDELRARALTRRRLTRAWINVQRHWLIVDAAGATRAEELVETLRDTLGSLAVQPLEVRHSPAGAMTAWLAGSDAPGRFAIEQDLELKAGEGAGIGPGATVRYVRHPLDGAEIRAHLNAGKTPTRLGLSWNARIACVLQQDLQIKRVQFLDLREDGQAKAEDPLEQFDIDFALLTGELTQLLDELLAALGGADEGAVREAA